MMKNFSRIISFFFLLVFLMRCQHEQEDYLFETLDSRQTGLNFSNSLTSYADLNMFTYMYFFNGAGIGAGDFNNDGWIDLFFAANQKESKLFLNKGSMKFDDVTKFTGIQQDSSWRTGVCVVDINQDGLLDIYISKVGNFGRLQSNNELWVCKKIDEKGMPQYENMAASYGLDFSTFGTQSVFFDYDLDGDQDMYMMNHSLRFSGTFHPRDYYAGKRDSLAGDRLLRNDNGRFIDVSDQSGILGNIIGYGLGISVADVNLDGWPDIYIANDFHENDYLYINNQNGTFSESCRNLTSQTSQFSMGVDIGDLTNDGYPEIATVDMLPYDPYLLKRSLGEDRYDVFNHKLKYGYHPQYARNTLQLNRQGQYFSEIGRYAGIQATDWSWSVLLFDFENDGKKDIFISNGIPKRMNDIDYVKFISDEAFQEKIAQHNITDKELALVDKFPEIKIPNAFFKNEGEAKFDNISKQIKENLPTFSNGAIYSDLDNDGDLDIVVNNINDNVLLYKNRSETKNNLWLQVKPAGPPGNKHAIGSKILVYSGSGTQWYENYATRGFMSSMNQPITVGFGTLKPDSILFIWPDNTYEKLNLEVSCKKIELTYKNNLPSFNYNIAFSNHRPLTISDFTKSLVSNIGHEENNFNEFNREPLIPHMVSREGPGIAYGDYNADGITDIFMGSCKLDTSKIFIGQKNGTFKLLTSPALEEDNNYEDIDAFFDDLNGDNKVDLLVLSGGNEYFGESKMLKPRLYLQDAKGRLYNKKDAFPDKVLLTGGSLSVWDYDGNGVDDVFLGARAVPFQYGLNPISYILKNDGNGNFIVDEQSKIVLADIGMVTDSKVGDLNGDGKEELVVSTEWGEIFLIQVENGKFNKTPLTTQKGWWTTLTLADMDLDGKLDIIAGNLGKNHKFQQKEKQLLTLYVNDFDDNGQVEPIITYFIGEKEILLPNHEEILGQLPGLKKKYLYAENFAKANWKDILPEGKIRTAVSKQANYFSHVILYNAGNFAFDPVELPWLAQLTTYRDFAVTDINHDHRPDIIPGGNFFHNNIQLGRFDADRGSVLINQGNRNFTVYPFLNTWVTGEVRKIIPVGDAESSTFIYIRNNQDSRFIKMDWIR